MSLQEKLKRAKDYLGEKYVQHPQYKFHERHSFLTVLWYPNRVLRPIETAAREAGRL
jgi:hypothetical protein